MRLFSRINRSLAIATYIRRTHRHEVQQFVLNHFVKQCLRIRRAAFLVFGCDSGNRNPLPLDGFAASFVVVAAAVEAVLPHYLAGAFVT